MKNERRLSFRRSQVGVTGWLTALLLLASMGIVKAQFTCATNLYNTNTISIIGVAISNVLSDLNATMYGTSYPNWSNCAPAYLPDVMASGGTSNVLTLLNGCPTNEIPPAFLNDAVAAANNSCWKSIVITNNGNVTTGQIAYSS